MGRGSSVPVEQLARQACARMLGPDMHNMGNWAPIVALGREGLGKWENGKGENKVWCKSGIRCQIMNILVQHVWACENNVGNYVKCLKMDFWYSEIEVESK